MKQIIYAVILLFVAVGCASVPRPSNTDGGYEYLGFDFRKYSDQKFMFSPYPPKYDYDTRGLLTIRLTPKVTEIPQQLYLTTTRNNNIYYETKADGTQNTYFTKRVNVLGGNTYYYAVEVIEPEEAIDKMYEQAMAMNANAVVDFEIVQKTANDNGLTYAYYEVTGLAVRIYNEAP